MATPGIMTIDRLEVHNFGSVNASDFRFKRGLNVIQGKGSKELLEIINCIISGRATDTNYDFTAQCTVNNRILIVESGKENDFSSLTPVERRLCLFDAKVKYDWSREFHNYLNEDERHPYNTLAKLTCGIASTHSFRVYLNKYVDQLIVANILKENGVFRRPSGTSQTQFIFDCYANVLNFWDGFNEIRDFNHIRLPVCVLGDGLNYEVLGKRQIFSSK